MAGTLTRRKPVVPTQTPGLHSGDLLAQEEFHRRYLSEKRDLKLELIDGVVFMASPVGAAHGRYQARLVHLLSHYESFTAGAAAVSEATVILDSGNEVRPDAALLLLPDSGGKTGLTEEGYITGGPEWVGEVAHSSVAIDLHRKKAAYQRAGVLEYCVVCVAEQKIEWFHFKSRRRITPDSQGVLRSRVFPGLWINGPALLANAGRPLIATLEAGLASPEHADFLRRLNARQTKEN